MKKRISAAALLMAGALLVTGIAPLSQTALVFADETASAQAQTDGQTGASDTEPSDKVSVTNHRAVIGGKKIDYTATAGIMVVDTKEGQVEFFYTAYTKDGVNDMSDRPITFAFNGGPGSSTMWLHMGCLGPRRVVSDENGQPVSLPPEIVDNEYSILDLTDLVFIDAPGTGYSRVTDKDKEQTFYTYENDIMAVGDFIRLYVNRNKRWSSPKYVAGESYGTTRAVGLCKYLADTFSMDLNGIILVSAIHNFIISEFDNDYTFVLYLPTYAADAWYHKTLDDKYQNMKLEDFLDEVRSFAGGEYLGALFKGNSLTSEEVDSIAEKLAAYTGLKKDLYIQNNLRVDLETFARNLLSDQKLAIGRMDGRATGALIKGSLEDGVSDPSDFGANGQYGNAVNQYITDELGFETDRLYVPLSLDVNGVWKYSENDVLKQEQIISDSLVKNPFLKIWVLCGYYDAATPFYGAEWYYNHVFVSEERKNGVTFTYYPTGHMIYTSESALKQFKQDAQEWYGK